MIGLKTYTNVIYQTDNSVTSGDLWISETNDTTAINFMSSTNKSVVVDLDSINTITTENYTDKNVMRINMKKSMVVHCFVFNEERKEDCFSVISSFIDHGYNVLPKEGKENTCIMVKTKRKHFPSMAPKISLAMNSNSSKSSTSLKSVRNTKPVSCPTSPRVPPRSSSAALRNHNNTVKLEMVQLKQHEGRINKEDEEIIRKVSYTSGIEMNARDFVWKLCLGYYSFDMTEEERKEVDKEYERKLNCIKAQRMNLLPEQLQRNKLLRSNLSQIEKDIIRTKFQNEQTKEMIKEVLELFVIYNNDVGYVQGMNDICHLLSLVYTKEEDVFWMFSIIVDTFLSKFIYLDKLKENINKIGNIIKLYDNKLYTYLNAMNSDYMFCYKWIILLFNREFKKEDTMRLWDFSFAFPEREMYYYICSSILISNSKEIISNGLEFDGLVALFQSLHKKLNSDVKYMADIIYQHCSNL